MTEHFRVNVRVKGGAPVATDASLPSIRSDYMRGNRGVTFAGWRPVTRDPQDTVAMAWDAAAARATDMIHNSGWISGMIDQAVANVVGTGLRLRAIPENSLFGMSEKDARKWARVVEAKFALWANNRAECDIEGRRTFGQMQAAGYSGWHPYGEIVAELPYRRRIGSKYGTKVRMIPPHRLSRKTEAFRNLVSGVLMDGDGFPIGYVATRRDQNGFVDEYEVPAADRFGRPRVIHVFDGALGTVRGISPLVPALQVARQFDQLADATLSAALAQSVFAATVTSDDLTEEALAGLLTPQEQAKFAAQGVSPYDAWFAAQSGWYENAILDVGMNGRIAHLFPGQKMEFHSSKHPNGNYKDFALHLLREIARCLGLTYESATGDYTNATYSSVRMAVNEIFSVTTYRRQNIVAPFCAAVYEAWLEEAIEVGEVEFPGGIEAFVANRAAASRSEWRGAPRPQADDLKAAKAAETYYGLGVVSEEDIANDMGRDLEDVYAARARAKALREEYGLPEPEAVKPDPTIDTSTDFPGDKNNGGGNA